MKLRRTQGIDDAISKWQQMQGDNIAGDRISAVPPNPESANASEPPTKDGSPTGDCTGVEMKKELSGRNGIASSPNFGEEWIDHAFFVELATQLNMPLRVFGKGTEVYLAPKPAAPAKPQEYVELMDRLRREAQEKEYQELIGKDYGRETLSRGALDAQELKEVKEEVSTIFNILISVVAVAWAIWYWTPYWPLPARTLLCLFGAILILVAEVVVYLGYRRRVTEARALERAKKERKQVIVSGFEAETKPEAKPETEPEAKLEPASAGPKESQVTPQDILHAVPKAVLQSRAQLGAPLGVQSGAQTASRTSGTESCGNAKRRTKDK